MTIVNQYPIMESVLPIWVFLVLAIFTVLSVLVASLAFQNKLPTLGICLTVFALLSAGAFLFGLLFEVKSGRTRYECLIDDTTPFVEVAENYDITGRRGELWILEDKVDE